MQLEESINDIQMSYVAQIEGYLEEMRNSRIDLESLQLDAGMFLQQNHSTVLIEQHQQKLYDLLSTCDRPLPAKVNIDMDSLQGKQNPVL